MLHRLAYSASLGFLFVFLTAAWAIWPAPTSSYVFPGGHRAAIAICDDTDDATLENTQPVYEFLASQGVISTKTVWALPAEPGDDNYTVGTSISDPDYLNFILMLQNQGFEIASHGARGASTERLQLTDGLEFYRRALGAYPDIHINHSKNKDNIYWGSARLSNSLLRELYQLALPGNEFFGHVAGSPYYWGDVALKHIEYSRDFSFYELNLAKVSQVMPYYDPEKPMIKKWFHTSDGHDVTAFNILMRTENLDQLEQEGGYSIVYTHFGKGFYTENGLNQEFQERIQDLTKRDIWITTTGELLRHLELHQEEQQKSCWELLRVQLRWIVEKLWHGRS